MSEEISAIFLRETHRWDDTAVLECELVGATDLFDKTVKVKVEVPEGELEPHLTYRFYGRWTQYFNKRTGQSQKQFYAKTHVETKPHGKVGVVAYLMQAPNIGRALASKLYAAFADKAIEVLREDPAKAAAAAGRLTVEHAEEAAEFLQRKQKTEAATVDLLNLLSGRGFRKHLFKELLCVHGNAAAERVRANPYLLLDFHGVGFLSADKFYLDLGKPPGAIMRQVLCVRHIASSDNDGNTWISARDVRAKLADLVGAAARPEEAIDTAARVLGLVKSITDELGERWIADCRRATSEGHIVALVHQALREASAIPPDLHLSPRFANLTPGQLAALRAATPTAIGVLLGGPGTGKSFTTAALVAALCDHYGPDAIAVMAPTGKAAVRLTAAFHEADIPIVARTVHSTLSVRSCAGSDWDFEYDETNPLPVRFMVLDEGGMLDVPLFRSVLAARDHGTKLLIVGDTHQLPPIGHGRPLADLVATGMVPVGELTEPMRNAGTIAFACADMRAGQQPRSETQLDPDAKPPKNFKVVNTSSLSAAKATIERVIGMARAAGMDPVWDVQIVIATNEKGELSRKNLNPWLQSLLQENAAGKTFAEDNRQAERFVEGDKVICVKNGLYLRWDDARQAVDEEKPVAVANGEFGSVWKITPGFAVVEFSNPDRLVWFGKHGDGDSRDRLELGYACTCHKMQGSECPVAIVALDPAGNRVTSKEWFYTAISRGKYLSVAIGDGSLVRQMLRKLAVARRKTFLRERLLAEVGRA